MNAMSEKINDIEIRHPSDHNDTMWYSCIKNLVERLDFGTLEVRLTVKGGKVTTVKVHSEKSFAIQKD